MKQNVFLAIDPGDKESAYVFMAGSKIVDKGKVPNEMLHKMLKLKKSAEMDGYSINDAQLLVIEWIQGYGLRVGQSVFETCRWVGKFEEAWGGTVQLMGRKEVKSHLCGTTNAGDPHVREALIDRYGPQGTKRKPGPLYGVVGDVLAALAVATTWMDKYGEAIA